MQVAILIISLLAAILFIVSGLSFIFSWGYFKFLAIGFLALAITTFILMRDIQE